jgi:hypothetical protein
MGRRKSIEEMNMAVQTLTLAAKRLVLMPESEYRKLKPKATTADRTSNGRVRKMTKQDIGDLAEHRRRMAEGGARPYEELRKELGLK